MPAALAAVAGLLVAAERAGRVELVERVGPHHAGRSALAILRIREPLSVHTPAERPYGVLLAFSTASLGVRKVSTDSTGPKISSRAIRCAWETPVNTVGGNQKPWVGSSHGGDQRPGALGLADVGQLLDPGELLGGVDGADVGVLVERVADPQRGHPALEPVEQLVGDRLLHQQPRARAADVALVEEDAVDDALDRLVDRGVVEDDVGGLAAELEGDLLVASPATLRAIALPTSVEPVKATLSTSGCSTSALPGVAGAGDDVDDARRQVGLLADLGEQQRGQRRGLGRLEHDGVAAGQRRGDLPRQHQQREVPRDDLAGDAERRGCRSRSTRACRPSRRSRRSAPRRSGRRRRATP